MNKPAAVEAVIAAHDEELEKLEAETTAKVEAEAKGETITPTPVPQAETPTPATPSATVEKPETTEEKKDDVTPPAKPDGEKPEGDNDTLSDEEVQKLSPKAQKRFKSLSDRNKRLERENGFLKSHIKPDATPSPEPSTPANPLPWAKPIVTGEEEEPTPAEVAESTARATVQQELRNKQILDTFASDAKELESQYPELNPEHESYRPELVTKIAVWYRAQFKDNEELRLKDFVTELMSLRAEGIEQGRTEVTDKVVQQAAEQAIVSHGAAPAASSTVEQAIGAAKSIDELEEAEKLIG